MVACSEEHERRVSLGADGYVHEIQGFGAQHLVRVGVGLTAVKDLRCSE
jgi:hypothetical protein